MQDNQLLQGFLVAPDDHSPLQVVNNHLSKRGFTYPNVGDIPFLFESPAAALFQWQSKVQMAVRDLQGEIKETRNALSLKGIGKKSQDRLRALVQGMEHNLKILFERLGPLFAIEVKTLELLDALEGRHAMQQGLFAYQNALLRDWAYEDADDTANAEALSFVLKTLGSEGSWGPTLFLGAGGSRLPLDLCRVFRPPLAVMCDINPWMLFIAKALYEGERIPYYEIPGAPKDFQHVAVKRLLAKRAEGPENVFFLLADALRQPFAAGAFHTLVTPWFIDIVHQDLSDLLPQLNRILPQDGLWVNFGPLYFDHCSIETKYSFEEVKLLVEKCGFRIETFGETTLPYVASPASAHHRSDKVYAFGARKVKAIEKPAKNPPYLPEWLRKPEVPVPALERFAKVKAGHDLKSAILAQIDGQRGIEAISQLLIKDHGMTKEQALPSLFGFFIEFYEAELRQKFRGLE